MTEKSTEFLGQLKHVQETTPRTLKRVLILTTAYLPQIGGSELAIKNITDRLSEIRFDLITSRLSKDVPEYEKNGNVNVYRVGQTIGLFSFLLPKNFLPVAVLLKAVKLIRKQGLYDAIHAYQASQAAGGGWLLKWIYPKIPFLLTMQEGKDLNKQPWLMRFFRHLIFRKANAATVISNYLAQYVRSQNSRMTISVVPNGVDIGKFQPDSGHSPKTIITISRLVEKNGLRDLIDAIAIVKKEIPDIKLLVIGDGEQAEELKIKSSLLELKDNIEFTGEVSPDR